MLEDKIKYAFLQRNKNFKYMYDVGGFIAAIAILLSFFMIKPPKPKSVSLDYINRISMLPFTIKVDLNNDKRKDIVAVSKEGKLYYFLNLNKGEYEKHYLTDLVIRPYKGFLGLISEGEKVRTSFGFSILLPERPLKLELEVKDKDGDNDIDIYVSDLVKRVWFINNGKGKFREKYEKGFGYIKIGVQ